jgi:hypothetical protein
MSRRVTLRPPESRAPGKSPQGRPKEQFEGFEVRQTVGMGKARVA